MKHFAITASASSMLRLMVLQNTKAS